MPRSCSFSSAYTPPRRTRQSSSSLAPSSCVDALFGSETCAYFADDSVSHDAGECGFEGVTVTSRGDWAESEKAYSYQCRSCRETHRLRNALKRIEEEYVAEIESLRLLLHEAAAQRTAAVSERNDLLASADATATQMLRMEREAKSLGVEVVGLSQENEQLRLRVQELEKEGAATREKHRTAARVVLEDTEAAERAHVEATEKDEAFLLQQLCTAESARVAGIAHMMYVSNLKKSAAAAAGGPAAKRGSSCTIISSNFLPEVSSPVSCEESRERRSSSPRLSQRQSITVSVHTQRLADSHYSPRGRCGGASAAATSRCTLLFDPAKPGTRATADDDAVCERIKRLEWSLEQQRSSYEMQLAEERALTSEMQAEMDDLIESELVLLEANGRVVVERDWAEAVGDAARCFLQSHRVALCLQQASRETALTMDWTHPEVSSATSPCASSGESRECGGLTTKKRALLETEEFSVEPAVCEAILPVVLMGVEEVKRDMGTLNDNITRCHAAAERTYAQQERMEALLRRIVTAVTLQRCGAEETHSGLRQVAEVFTHDGDALLLSEWPEEVTVTAQTPAAALVERGKDNSQTKGAHSAVDLNPPLQAHTEMLQSIGAPDATLPRHRSHVSAAYVSDALAPRLSDMRVVEVGEGLFDPHRIRVDANVVTQQMAALLKPDGNSESSDEDISQTPYDAY